MSFFSRIKISLVALQFRPSLIGIFVNPFFIARKGLYDNIRKLGKSISGKVLDVGCGTKPYEKLFSASQYIGLDTQQSGHKHYNSKVDVYYDGKVFPFTNGEFDAVVCFQVLDDIFDPDSFLKEVNRVLKSNGNLLLTVSFVWEEHEQPYDNVRYTSFGLNHVLSNNGFEVVQLKKSVNNFGLVFQLINAYIYRVLSFHILAKMLAFLLAIPFTVLGLLLGFILPRNHDLYLDNIVLARKTGPAN